MFRKILIMAGITAIVLGTGFATRKGYEAVRSGELQQKAKDAVAKVSQLLPGAGEERTAGSGEVESPAPEPAIEKPVIEHPADQKVEAADQEVESTEGAPEAEPNASERAAEERYHEQVEEKGLCRLAKAISSLTDPRPAAGRESEWFDAQLAATQKDRDSVRKVLGRIRLLRHQASALRASRPEEGVRIDRVYEAREAQLADRLAVIERREAEIQSRVSRLEEEKEMSELAMGGGEKGVAVEAEIEKRIQERFEGVQGLPELGK